MFTNVLPNITIYLAVSSHPEARYNCLMADNKPWSEITSPLTPHNLPLALASFIGREQEVERVQQALTQTRLLTLTGAGGCGKSRLAVAVAEQLRDNGRFPDGVWLIELAALTDPALVTFVIAIGLGLRQTDTTSPLATLLAYLQSRTCLLLLDNCEHLIEACAQLAEALLQHCPHLTILATSREGLRLSGETIWPVPPLSLPEATDSNATTIQNAAAVQLFIARATALDPTFQITDENAQFISTICQKLDGLPLAIELAASQIKLLPVADLAQRLETAVWSAARGSRTAAFRHQTLPAAVAWSYDLLTASEKELFTRLCTFTGDFSLAAAAAISQQSETQLLPLLAQLVEKSLVQRRTTTTARYRLLQTVRHFGQSLLREIASAQLCHAHTHFYLDLAERIAPHLNKPDRATWLDQLQVEHDNLRVAIQWSLSNSEWHTALRLINALWWFWFYRGFWSEGRNWLAQIISLTDAKLQTSSLYAHALLGAGVLAWAQGNQSSALRMLEQANQLAHHLEETDLLGFTLLFSGAALLSLADFDEAWMRSKAGIAAMETADNPFILYLCHTNAGLAALFHGEMDMAVTHLTHGAEGLRQIGDRWAVSLPLRNLGYIAFQQGNYARAAAYQREALASLRGLNEKWFVSRCLEMLAETVCQQGEFEQAVVLFAASTDLREAVGAALLPYYEAEYEAGMAAAKAALDEATFVAAWAYGRQLTLGDWEQVIDVALTPATTSARPSAQPELRILAFGSPQVYRDGELISGAEWQYAKPRELLFYLLAYGRRSKAQIGLALWPDASSEQLRGRFHITLYQLRQALGRAEWIVYSRQSYAFNRSLPYWFDVDQFRYHLAQAENEATAVAISHLEQAVALYQGDVLAEFVAGDWLATWQEQLRQQFVAALLRLGELYVAEGKITAALSLYRRAISHDNLLEAAHRELMRCYARLGEPAQALRHFEEFAQLLADELDTVPASETADLVQQLRQGNIP